MSFRTRLIAQIGSVAVLALVVSAGTAGAADRFSSPTLSANVSTSTTVVTPTTRRIVGRITVKAGAKTIAVAIDAGSPHFKRIHLGKTVPEGPTLRPVRFRSVGPERRILFDGSGTGLSGNSQCEIVEIGAQLPHGGDFYIGLSRAVILQARQSVTVEVDFDVASDAPWVGTDYAPVFRVGPAERDLGDGTMLFPKGTRMLKKPVTLRTPRPAVIGPFAARIDITSTGDAKSAERGVIRGSLFPAAAGRTINFAATRWRSRTRAMAEPTPIGTAITAADGSFALPVPMLSRTANYSIMPSYPGQPGDLVANVACPFTFWGKTRP